MSIASEVPMWEYEHSIEVADVTPAQVWARYSDTATWPEWDKGIVSVTLDGPFVAGTTGTMRPEGQEPLPFTLTEAVPDQGFTDETVIPDAVTLRFVHRLAALPGGGTRITHRLEIEGPAAAGMGPELGPQITEDFPDAMQALAKVAGQVG
ncbi:MULTISPECIES: SRPBCC family protein [unclassified Streptomyces]|uniref:SRPBCC family protein n=1 Tax=unclassified Streptomyces TaxID=2593676 RepID=UPI001F3341D8|nr:MULTISPECIES: SRPBCC family protein [unclassified Streptomyces]WKX19648.1 SRPBCC family protein [Streptomyces sp. HUAS CX7]